MRASYPSLVRYAQACRHARRRARRRVLVIAPHPDDDAIGCGGTLARLARRRARISVVYVTDGGASHVKSQRFPPAKIRDLREAEARNALRVLGLRTAPRFLRAPDGELAALCATDRTAIVAALAAALERTRAQVVFVPWARDPHPDHIAVAALADVAIAASRRRPVVYAYGVWLTVRGTAADAPPPDALAVDVRLSPGELTRKRSAIREHRTQLGEVIDDDPDGFCIDEALLAQWLTPCERFFRVDAGAGIRAASGYQQR